MLAVIAIGQAADGPTTKPTFTRDIAPILFSQCSACHRPGGMGPFDLLIYADAKKRAKQIAEVTQSRLMPPWMPEPGCGNFAGTRRLSDEQITTIQRWTQSGAVEGDPAQLPARPQWRDGWQLGPPDLVVTLPEPFPLPADGKDVYRNFVIPAPNTTRRFVRAVEIRPGNAKIVHHAFLLVDRTGESRRLDAQDPGPGFGGMSAGGGATSPPGHFVGWNPGRLPKAEDASLAWPLEPNTDLVLQLHLRPSGKPETVQTSIGFYFTDKPPDKLPMRLLLRSVAIDIPASAKEYAIESSYALPVAVSVLAVRPHAHYLGKELKGWAVLPDGSVTCLLDIKNWDFNWQDDYQFNQPVPLPKGSVLHMRYTYDNSAANVRNPSHPPQRVTYGLQTTDEMGEFWLQVLPANPADRELLVTDYGAKWVMPDSLALYSLLTEREPNNAGVRVKLASVLAVAGRADDAIHELERALATDPRTAGGHRLLGQIHSLRNDTARAKSEFTSAIQLDPNDYIALNDLGSIIMAEGNLTGALGYFEQALRANPNDEPARKNLQAARALLERSRK